MDENLQNHKERKIPIQVNKSRMEDICIKKCIRRINKPQLSYGELNCVDHCYSKALDSLKHGELCLGYLEKETNDLIRIQNERKKKFMPKFLEKY